MARKYAVPKVLALVRDDAGRVLLGKHYIENWVLPGGAIEPNEIPAETALREMKEETGLEGRISALIGAYGGPEFLVRYPNGDQLSYVMLVYECEVLHGEPRPDGQEILECRYVTRLQAEALPMPAWMHRMLDDVFPRRQSGG